MAKQAKASGQEESQGGSRGRKRVIMAGVFASVLLGEAIGVFAIVKSFSKSASPTAAQASEATASAPAESGAGHGGEKAPATAGHGVGGLDTNEGEAASDMAEVKIGQFRSQNRRSQQAYMLDYTVFATVAESDRGKLEQAVKSRDAEIRDRFTRILRAMEPERFSEPDLTTLRTQLKDGLAKVLGPELPIQKVLLTDFVCQTD